VAGGGEGVLGQQGVGGQGQQGGGSGALFGEGGRDTASGHISPGGYQQMGGVGGVETGGGHHIPPREGIFQPMADTAQTTGSPYTTTGASGGVSSGDSQGLQGQQGGGYQQGGSGGGATLFGETDRKVATGHMSPGGYQQVGGVGGFEAGVGHQLPPREGIFQPMSELSHTIGTPYNTDTSGGGVQSGFPSSHQIPQSQQVGGFQSQQGGVPTQTGYQGGGFQGQQGGVPTQGTYQGLQAGGQNQQVNRGVGQLGGTPNIHEERHSKKDDSHHQSSNTSSDIRGVLSRTHEHQSKHDKRDEESDESRTRA
jgi:hypothetical protein